MVGVVKAPVSSSVVPSRKGTASVKPITTATMSSADQVGDASHS